jgi:hypothetical protein
MNTKLTDFSIEELKYLQDLVQKDWDEETSQIVDIETIFCDVELIADAPEYRKHKERQEMAARWLSQLSIAQDIVIRMETVNNN